MAVRASAAFKTQPWAQTPALVDEANPMSSSDAIEIDPNAFSLFVTSASDDIESCLNPGLKPSHRPDYVAMSESEALRQARKGTRSCTECKS